MIGASIDLGSNSFICLIFEVDKNGKSHTLEDKIVLTRLSESVDQDRTLSNEALKRSEAAFKSFLELFKKYNVERVQAVATSAARDAKNQDEFIQLAAKYQIPVQIISGEQEAQLTFLGVKNLFTGKKGIIIDIGGGSTEYIFVIDGKIEDRISFDMGAVRFFERYLKGKKFSETQNFIRKEIQKVLSSNLKIKNYSTGNFELFLAVSGTPTSASAILMKKFDPLKIENSLLSMQDLKILEAKYCSISLDKRLDLFPYIEEKRADVLPVGILILQESLKFFSIENYKVSTKGIRHGVAFNMSNSPGLNSIQS